MSNLNIVSYSSQGKTMASQGACLSGTGVFYQAMPAVGTDGRTVMNLIPVQKVNGQFVQSPTGTIKDIAETKRDYTSNVPSISKSNISISGPTAKEQFVNKRPFYVSTSPNPANLTGIYPSVRIQTPIVTTKVAQSAGSLTSPEFTCGNTFGLTLINKKKLPVTVKSPALPNGQYLQIPPNAQVKTLPASALPPGIKRQIFTSSTTCASNSPMVLYVSPVQTMKHNYVPTSPKSAPSLSRLPRSSGQTLSTCSSTGSRQCSITAKDGKRLVTPIKWVIEEADGLPAPCRVPVNSSSMTSDILKTVAEMEKASKPCDHTAKNYSTSQEGQTKIGQEKDNALVMYNGKVYFVANKTPALCNRPSKPLEASRSMGTSSTQAKENVGFNQRISLPPSLPLCSSSGSQLSNKTRPDPKHIVIPDEIIDLCDDDSQDDLTCQAISTRDVTRQLFRQSEVDEDEDSNVIFVSYLPPKAVPKVGEGEMSHMLDDFGAGQEMVRSQNNLNGEVVDSQNNVSGLSIERCQNVGTAHDMADCQDIATGQELNSRQQNITGQDWKRLHMEGFYGSATGLRIENIQSGATTQEMGNIQNDATDQSIGNSQHNASTQEMENIPESTALQTEMETHKKKSSSDPIPEQQTSMLDQESLETCDRLLKQMFGITSDVQICLKRIDSKPKANPKVFPQIGTTNKRTIEAIRKLLQRSIFVTKKRVHNETQVSATRNNDSCPKNAKRQKIEKVENAFKSSENPEPLTSQTPQLDMQPLTSQTPQLILQPLTSQTPQLILQPLTSQTHQLILQPLTSQTPQLILQPLTSQTPQLILQPLTSQTPQLILQPLTSQTPQLDIQPLTSQTPQLILQPLTSQTPQLDMQPLTSQTPQLDMQPLTSQTPQLDIQPLTSQTPQLILQPLTSQTPQLDIQPLTSQTPQLILQPLTSQTPQLILQPLTSQTPQLDMQLLTSQTPQLDIQPLTSQTPQLDMQLLTSQTPQLDIQPLTSQTPQLDMQPLTSQTPQLILQPLTSQTPQLDMQPLTSQTPQLDIQPLTSQTPQLDIQPLTSQTPQLDMQPLTSQTPQLDMFFDGEQIFVYEEPTVNYFISTTDETVVPSKPLPDLDLVHISKPSSISPVSSVHPQTNTEAMDCAPRPCCGTESNIKPNSRRRRRGKGRRCTVCPCEVTGTQVKAMSTSSTSQEEPDSSKPQNTRFSGNRTSAVVESTKRKGRKSTKAQAKDKEPASMEIQCPSTMSEQGSSTAGEIPTSYLCSTAPMDTEEIKRHERIKRLKDLLKEKEAALEMIRKNMS